MPSEWHLGSDLLQMAHKFDGMNVSDAKRLRLLEEENAPLGVTPISTAPLTREEVLKLWLELVLKFNGGIVNITPRRR